MSTGVKNELAAADFVQSSASQAEDPKAIWIEILLLLEDYGPMWYTEEHRSRLLRSLVSPTPMSIDSPEMKGFSD